ncbi:hypothetical protein MLD38_028065 [Melastoma candidum]|uniref:Uncharacterized protein n=1 Tax=Melastoma candidum TaxID=119954 RepID=A0ACB9N1H4_9MYRT|nr:hypothetical protein MLD38_028065 [Melastoma candidum]
MDLGRLHEPKATCYEDERSDQPDDGTGSARSYSCVFCKRGFTTAQALGGHMNIHRKDRAKARPDSSNPSSFPSNPNEKHSSFSSYFPFSNHPPHQYPVHEPQTRDGHPSYSPSSGRRTRPSNGHSYGNDLYVPHMPRSCNLPEEDWRWGLSLQVGTSNAGENKEKGQAGDDGDGLDLELRLGHEH